MSYRSDLYAAAVLADSPKAYWKCQEASGLPQDSSGNGLHITTADGAPGYHTAGPLDDFAIQFNGGERFLRNPLVSTQADNITYETWLRVTVLSVNNQTLDAWNSDNNGWGLVGDVGGSFKVVVKPTNTAMSSEPAIGMNVWKHFVIVRDSGTWKYYVNGVLTNSNAGATAPGTPITGQTFWGCAQSIQANRAHIAMYETVLSAARVQAHYEVSQETPRITAYVN